MQIDRKKLPGHIAIIMDGNLRWARKRGLAAILGHANGAKSVEKVTEACRQMGIKALTLYAFSTENWKRPAREIDGLMNLLHKYLVKEEKKLLKNGIRLNAIGRLERLPPKVREKLFEVIEKTSKNVDMILTLALNYGARQEITDAVRILAEKVEKGEISANDITEEIFEKSLYTKNLPEPDLLIRTSGESRLSNFLLWQVSYAEIYITDKLWPDFGKADIEKAVLEYQKRERRYGGR
ncbi:MAG: isoprenyl transferase [Candidatus Omnitrophica bacterium]|nr:isoprenyl transferase [Candidatus Omnitrophota bacterium]